MSVRTSLRARLQRGDQSVGVLVPLTVGSLVEMSAAAGMDFVLIDCEHGPVDYLLLEHAITVAELHGTNVFVRVGINEHALVQRALDTGAAGIIFPHVDTVEQAQAAVWCSRYPPLGGRGFSNYSRTARFGRVDAADHARAEERDTIVVAMIESSGGYRALGDILTTPGIDGIMSGPADLAISSGVSDPALIQDKLADIHDRVSATDKFELAVVGTKQDARQCLSRGVQMVAVNLGPVIMDLLDDWKGLVASS